MDEQKIYAKLTDIFRDIFDDDTLERKSDMTADDIPDWDSANHINITVASESAFGIKFNSSELEELRNVGNLVATIKRKMT